VDDRFGSVDLVVVGSMNVDQFTYCRRLPADGETLVADRYVQGFGGKGANQAVMAARLGARVTMIGCLGDDDLGDATIANFARMGVDAAAVVRVTGVSSGVAPIWVDAQGTNRILIVPGANGTLTAAQVTTALAGRRADAVVAQLETPQAATAAAFAWARQVGALSVLNPAPAAPVEHAVLEHVDWLVANESEFALLRDSDPDADAVAAAARDWRCGVVVTLGAAGAVLATGSRHPRVSVPGAGPENLGRPKTSVVSAPKVTAVDTTGAGDAFVGTFAVALAAGLTAPEAARLGCAAGALSVQRPGTQPSFPTRAELAQAAAG
jgi:ribokinase